MWLINVFLSGPGILYESTSIITQPGVLYSSSSQFKAGSRRFVLYRPKSWQDTLKSARLRLSNADLFGQEVRIE